MSDEKKAPLVPKLRFSEFWSTGEWAIKPMHRLYAFKGNNSFSRDKLNYEHGSVKNIHYGDIHTKFSTHFDITRENVPYINQLESSSAQKSENFCLEGDIIFADASEDLEDIGKAIEIVRLDGERVVAGLHTILARQIENDLVLGFGGHLFKSKLVRTQIQKESQGTKVLGLSGGRLAKIRIPFPQSPSEQQKIADCLSSLDDLIAAQARKVDALKTHKKGLMQQLFPHEGETQPRLRFSEFQDAGEWSPTTIGQLGEVVTGSTPSTSKPEYYGGDRLFVSPSDISNNRYIDKTKTGLTKEGFLETRAVKANSILFVCIGSTIGKIAQNKQECATNQQINSVVPNSDNSDGFVYYALIGITDKITSIAGRQAVPIVNKSLFSSVELKAPKLSEQRRIANFLSSLDDVILYESKKFEALKTQKKGLMQQLFPSLGDAV